MSSVDQKTFKPKTGYLAVFAIFVVFFMGIALGCVFLASQWRVGMFYFLAACSALGGGLMLFVFLQINHVFTISKEGFQIKGILYPWNRIGLGQVTQETVKHRVMFVPVAQTHSEYFHIIIVTETSPKVKFKKVKILNKAYSQYDEIKALTAQLTKESRSED